jgi:hypothetical protein
VRVTSRGLFFALLATTLILTAACWYAINEGILYGPERIRYIRMLLVGLAVVTAAIVPSVRRRRRRPTTQERPINDQDGRDSRFQIIALVAGVAASAYAFAGLLLPSTPDDLSALPCPGASVEGAAFQATTSDQGLNARSGPGTSFEQIARFPANCTLGFDGYCLGDPISDLVVNSRQDNRWLLLHRHYGVSDTFSRWLSGAPDEDRFVASGVVQTQSSNLLLPPLDDTRCADAGGMLAPAPVTMQAEPSPDGIVYTLSADRAFDFGLAIYVGADSTTGQAYRQIPVEHEKGTTTATGTWTSAATASTLRAETPVVVLGASCLAVGVPNPDTEKASKIYYLLDLSGAASEQPDSAAVPDLARLAQTACQEVAS